MGIVHETEGYVLQALQADADQTMTIREVVDSVQSRHAKVEAVHVKVATLNLVNRGRVVVNADSNLVAAELCGV